MRRYRRYRTLTFWSRASFLFAFFAGAFPPFSTRRFFKAATESACPPEDLRQGRLACRGDFNNSGPLSPSSPSEAGLSVSEPSKLLFSWLLGEPRTGELVLVGLVCDDLRFGAWGTCKAEDEDTVGAIEFEHKEKRRTKRWIEGSYKKKKHDDG